MIPAQLSDCRFVLLRSREKIPIEPHWTTTANYAYGDTRLVQHLAQSGNYGVMAGNGLVILDCDTRTVEEIAKAALPATFTVRTGSGGLHLYFKSDLSKPLRLNEGNENIGDLQSEGKMVVGPNCTHPNGNKYRIESDLPLAFVSEAQFREVLAKWLRKEPPKPKTAFLPKITGLENAPQLDRLINLGSLQQFGSEWRGEHPIHGSKNGWNFNFNPSQGVWHCFRHETGGGAWEMLAMQEGLLQCEDARSGCLRGGKFKRVREIAKAKGLIRQEARKTQRFIFENGKLRVV